MKKGKDAKAVNRVAKRLNRSLERDVFGNRFAVRQVRKSRSCGMEWFLYEMIDREEPRRNRIVHGWLNVFDAERRLFTEINDFIVRSDFWAKYHNDPSCYRAEEDVYKLYPENY